ncbi:MAG: TonB-dependent siderophore receptor [Weeksellaceae bacterium]
MKKLLLSACMLVSLMLLGQESEQDSINTINLNEIIVTGVERVTANKSKFVGKIPLTQLENSQVYTGITQALILQQKLYNLEDVVKNAPGINAQGASFGGFISYGGESFLSRGFGTQIRAINGMSSAIHMSDDIQNTAKIEIIKGPSSTLYGNIITSYGGLINKVTKKPYARKGLAVDYSGGSFAYQRLGIDYNVPINKEKTFLSRWNVALNNQGNNKDNHGYKRGLLIAPSFTYHANQDLQIDFGAEINSREIMGYTDGIGAYMIPSTVNPVISSVLKAQGLDDATVNHIISQMPQTIEEAFGTNDISKMKLDPFRAFVSKDVGMKNKSVLMHADINYNISENWTSRTSAVLTIGDDAGLNSRLDLIPNAIPALLTSLPTGNLDFGTPGADYYGRTARYVSTSINSQQIQQNFNGNFNIGAMRNRMVIGVDYSFESMNYHSAPFRGNFFGIPLDQNFDVILREGDAPNYYLFNKNNIQNALEENVLTPYENLSEITNPSFYINNVLNITENLLVNAGVRLDYYDTQVYNGGSKVNADSFNQWSIGPKLGIVYQPIHEKLSIFTNYQTGAQNTGGVNKEGKVFKPENARQFEGGVKFSLFNNAFTGTASYYDIKVDDVIRYDYKILWQTQDGTKTSKGYEVQLLGNPTPDINILLGYAHNDSKYEKASPNVNGLRPADSGPENQFNIWAHYHFRTHNALNGFSIGAGVNYVGQTMVFNLNQDGSFDIPAYTLANLKLSYDKENYSISLRANNLLDEEVWTGNYYVSLLGKRQLVGSVAIKF